MNKQDIMNLFSIDSSAAEKLIANMNPAAMDAIAKLGASTDISLTEQLCVQVFLGGDDLPNQPCGETFKTRGKATLTSKTPIVPAIQLLGVIAQAFRKAMLKAELMCGAFSDLDCQTVEFVKYDLFDPNIEFIDNGALVTVELIIVWRCSNIV